MDALPYLGSVKVQNLDGYTKYSFTLTCTEAEKSVTLNVTTLIGRPSAPQNIAAVLEGKRVKLTWAAPATPAGPINNYRVKVDQKTDPIDIPATDLFYLMTEDYVPGTKHTFQVQACNKDQENHIICSSTNFGLSTFGEDATTTTTTTTVTTTTIATTTVSIGRQSQGVSVALIAVCLFFFQWVL